MIQMFEKLWQIVSAVLAVIALIGWSLAIWLYFSKQSIQSDYDKLNASLEVIGEDMNQKAKELPKEIEVIKWKTQQKIQVVKEYVYDENKTDCDNAIALLRRTGF